MLGGLNRVWEGKGVGEFCFDSRFWSGDRMKDGKGREWGNGVLTADCFRGIV